MLCFALPWFAVLCVSWLCASHATSMRVSWCAQARQTAPPTPKPRTPKPPKVHAEGEAEHAAIGHNAVLNLVPAAAAPLLRRAMADHDRDFAAFYNAAADMLEA